MSTADHPMGARLALEARRVGPARAQGRLYDFGAYPGLVAGSSSAEQVEGELYELLSPDHSLAWLDAYEGVIPGGGVYRDNEYARVEREVELPGGRRILAWVYMYQFAISQGRHVPEGRWRAPRTSTSVDLGALMGHDYSSPAAQGPG